MTKSLRSGWLYLIIFLLLVLTGYISAKETLHRMRQSGNRCDAIFFSIVDAYRSLDTVLNQSIRDTSALYKKLRPQILTDWPEPDRGSDLSFTVFNSFRIRMVEYDLYLDDIASPNPGLSLPETLSDTISDRRYRILDRKIQYNVQTRKYNTFIKQFPRNFYSSFFHFQARRPFELNSQLREQD